MALFLFSRAVRFLIVDASGSGALRPPPPVVAALVPRCALLPAATPRDELSAFGTSVTPIRVTPTLLDLAASTTTSKRGRYTSRRNCGSPNRAKPHHAGGGGGEECEARHERSNDWPQGGAQRSP